MGLGSDLMLKLIIAAQDKTGAAVDSVRQGIQSISTTAEKVWRAAQAYLTFQIAVEGANALKQAVLGVLTTGGQFETYAASLQALMGGVAQGKQAFAWIQQFAKDTPFELDGVTKAFIKLKAFGLDPMDGTLRNVAAATAKMGGGQAELEGIVLALGQAWTKQKLQAQDANQLLERGIPVWDILAKVMGKSTTEVMALSEAGAVGRKEIKALIDEMGRSSEGALEAQMKAWKGLTSNLADNWTQFLNSIAASGALDFFKAKVAEANAAFTQMAASGELQAKAAQISTAFTTMGRGIAGAAGFVVNNFASLTHAAEALAGVYAGSLVKSILAYVAASKQAIQASWQQAAATRASQQAQQASQQAAIGEAALRASLTAKLRDSARAELDLAKAKDAGAFSTRNAATAQKAVTAAETAHAAASKTLADAQAKLGAATVATAEKTTLAQKAMTGLSVLSNAFGPLVAAIMSIKFAWDEISVAIDDYKKRQAAVADGLQGSFEAHAQLKQKINETIAANREFADVAIESADAVAAKTRQQGDAYVRNLTQAQAYWNAVATQDKRLGDLDGMQQAERKAEAYGKAIDAARGKLEALHQAAAAPIAGQIDNRPLEGFAAALKAADAGTKEAKKGWDDYRKALSDADLTKVIEQARQKIEAITVATGGATAATQAWQAALDGAVRESLTRAGVDAEQALTGVSSAVRQQIGELGGLRQALTASGMEAQQVGKIIVDALSDLAGKAKTAQDVDAIRAELQTLSQGVARDTPLYYALADAFGKVGAAGKQFTAAAGEVAAAQAQARASADALANKIHIVNGKLIESTATAADYAKASADSANALRLQASAAGEASAKTGELTTSQLAQLSVDREKAAHNATVRAVNRQMAEESLAQAKAQAASMDNSIEDGKQMNVMIDAFSAAMLGWGDKGEAALKRIVNGVYGNFHDIFEDMVNWMKLAETQFAQVQAIEAGLSNAVKTGADLGYWVNVASDSFDKMDANHLTGLNAALDAAKQKLIEITQAAQSTRQALQDEFDQLEGNQAAIEERRYQTQIDKLKAQAELVKSTGDAQAQRDAAAALELAERIHTKKQADAAKEKEKEKPASAAPTPPPPVAGQGGQGNLVGPDSPGVRRNPALAPNAGGYANPTTQATIRLELALPTGKVVTADVPSQFETDLREVKRQMRAT